MSEKNNETNNEREKNRDIKIHKDSFDPERLGKVAGGKKIKFIHMSLFMKIAVAAIALILIISAIVVILKRHNSDEEKVVTITKSSLEKIIKINDMSTLEYTYNAIAHVNDEDGKAKYHVAYEGTVTAGIDITKVDVSVDEQNKKIKIVIPEAKIQAVDVDIAKMDFIFEKSKYETETVSQEAYKACLEDLEKRANSEDDLLSMAKENAVDSITALITPWVEQIDEEYSVKIK